MPRRTQAERRATTQAALLDAMLDSLVEDGYAGMSTRGVAKRAGVSQGTAQHYYASKTDFVLEAMRHAVVQINAEIAQRIDLDELAHPERQEELLDELWNIHKGRAFQASLELLTAARTDDDLRAAMRRFEREVTGLIADRLRDHSPAAGDAATGELLDIALAAIRGYAMLAPVVPQAQLDRRWKETRGHIAGALRARLAITR